MKFQLDGAATEPRVALTGAIDEKAGTPLTELRAAIDGARVVRFDCGGITAINSTGLRLWSQFLASLRGIAYEYHECSVYFVDYGNMSPALVKGAKIVSLLAPFHCRGCGKAATLRFEAADLTPEDGFGAHPCPSCGQALEPDIDAGSYLGLLEK